MRCGYVFLALVLVLLAGCPSSDGLDYLDPNLATMVVTDLGTFTVLGDVTKAAEAQMRSRVKEIRRDLDKYAPPGLFFLIPPEDVLIDLGWPLGLHEYMGLKKFNGKFLHWCRVGHECQSLNHKYGDIAACFVAKAAGLIPKCLNCGAGGIGHSWLWSGGVWKDPNLCKNVSSTEVQKGILLAPGSADSFGH